MPDLRPLIIGLILAFLLMDDGDKLPPPANSIITAEKRRHARRGRGRGAA